MAAEVVVEAWNAEAVVEAVRTAVAEALGATADVLAGRAAGEIGTAYPPASSPGQPPHQRSGALRAAQADGVEVDLDGDDVVAGVGIASGSPAADYANVVASTRPWLTQDLADAIADDLVAAIVASVTRAL